MAYLMLMRPNEVAVELGKRLKSHRLRKNLTQSDLAKKLELSVPTISSLENGKNTSLDTFIKVVFALGLAKELQELFNQPAFSIAELEQAHAAPKRQRASSKALPHTEQNKRVNKNSSKANLWNKDFFHSDE